LNELALFAGAGGGILGGHLLGWRTVAAVEIEDYPRRVLLQRQADGLLPRFPIWDDICTFDGKPWRGKVDVISGGFPCQDLSAAGKGAGLDGERSGLWREMARIVREIQPRYVFVENSPMLTSRGLGRVLGDLAEMGFDAKWGVLGGDSIGINTKRERIWILANSNKIRRSSARERKMDQKLQVKTNFPWKKSSDREDNLRVFREQYTDEILSRAFRGIDDVAQRMDALGAIGNGQIPGVAATAWRILK
jgi:DNA (cytosine-5)-methyltransferase 1